MLTMKAYKKFGLFQDPFTGDVAKADDVYLTDETRFVAEFLYQTAKAGGMVALLGESGSGKTTIRRYAMDRIQSEGQKIKIIAPPAQSTRRGSPQAQYATLSFKTAPPKSPSGRSKQSHGKLSACSPTARAPDTTMC